MNKPPGLYRATARLEQLKGVWQGSRLLPGGKFALLGTTMSPGFELRDLELGQRDVLVDSYPQFRDLITALTTPTAR